MGRDKKDKKDTKKIAEEFLIHSPEEEYTLYVAQQIEQLLRVGEQEKAEIYREAQELGLKILSTVRTK